MKSFYRNRFDVDLVILLHAWPAKETINMYNVNLKVKILHAWIH